ncbi:unnamed protein product [Rotaria sp. Silwood1]|nr:unnamed protein product [Rotaria sp. Silwood1]CAF1632273.1 unnamed protein product [Rotaria sp. Silwood1]CAF3827517.1 unnamed protein product [Rotaria sp. Silwood1]CAF4851754.1 unnamed protein product [Rotaria sp. Silwood1]
MNKIFIIFFVSVDNRLLQVAAKHNISTILANHLELLKDIDIVVVCADSASMKKRLHDMKYSRWDELRLIVEVVLEIGSIFNSSGIDVYFLNRPPLFNVSDLGHIDQAFAFEPDGYTPLVSVLRTIFNSYNDKRDNNKRVLVLVATDGEPINNEGDSDVAALEYVMQQERQSNTIYVTFLACTDDESNIAYMDEWENTMVNVNVTDDYRTERDFVHRNRGPHYPFSFGDHIAKSLLNAIDPKINVFNNLEIENNTNANMDTLARS